MEAKVIIVTIVKSNNSDNNVWAVGITGEEQPQGYCKSAYKAMRFAYLLKKRTGANIEDSSLKALSKEIAEVKAAKEKLAKAAEVKEEPSADNEAQAEQPEAEVAKPKKQRKPRAKKNAEATADVIAFL